MEQENVNLVNENESGFSLSDLLYLIKKNLLLIIIIVSAALVCGFVYGRFINKPTYSAKITTIVQADTNQAEKNTMKLLEGTMFDWEIIGINLSKISEIYMENLEDNEKE